MPINDCDNCGSTETKTTEATVDGTTYYIRRCLTCPQSSEIEAGTDEAARDTSWNARNPAP